MSTNKTAANAFPKVANDLAGRRIWVAGQSGALGCAVLRLLDGLGAEILAPTHNDLDLLDQAKVTEWVATARPDVVIMCSGLIGGAGEMQERPVDFLQANLLMVTHVLDAAHRIGVHRLVMMASSAVYPYDVAVPTREELVLSGPLPGLTAAYGLAKGVAIRLCEAYVKQFGSPFTAIIPSSLYGPDDVFFGPRARVVGALMGRMHAALECGASEVEVWGSGVATRDMLYIDDCAEALLMVAAKDTETVINVGSGVETSIGDLTHMIAEVVGWTGKIRFRPDLPEGTLRNMLDISRIKAYGWSPRTSLQEGLRMTFSGMRRSNKC